MESSGYNQALKEANDLSNQITAINADTEAKKLSLIGQGRGIPEAIIGGQQAKLDREAAIRTMPLTAQYKAAVGLVEAAKEVVNNFVADERAYQQSMQQWQNNVYSAVYQYATNQQKTLLDQQKELRDRQYALEDNFLEQQADIFKFALENGKGYLGSRIYKAKNMDELSAISSELGVSIGGTSGGDKNLFTQTQLNSGANTAGLPITEFNALDKDIKNFLINQPNADVQAVLGVIRNAKTQGDVDATTKEIDQMAVSQPVKTWLKGQLSVSEKSTWTKIKNFFGF
jgi:hypothetical protein